MTPTQYRAALAKLDLSQNEAARIFDADERTSRRWALGERSIPVPVGIMLRLMVAGKITADDVRAAHDR